jgi:hypothetical protein
MASANTQAVSRARTHEGGKTVDVSPLLALRRSVLTCLLWEDSFYEKGNKTAIRIAELVTKCKPAEVALLAVEARNKMQLRHVPLLLARELARQKNMGKLVAATLADVVQRPDELTEYLAIYWQDGRKPLSAGSKRGLRAAFNKFSRYQIAKYRDDDKKIKLADVLRIVRPKALNAEQNETYRLLRKGELESVDTWESELSAGKAKREVFERLITEKKLGAMATLRNLRNMQDAGVSDALIRERLAAPMPRVWPYRYVTAAKYAPNLEDALEAAMLRSVESIQKLPGRTGLLVDVSGSMDEKIGKAPKRGTGEDTTRIDVAAGLAILLREKADSCAIATFSDSLVAIAPRRGFALRDAIKNSQPHNGTRLRSALEVLKTEKHWAGVERVVVITDEQSQDGIAPAWTKFAYVINVASYQHGVGYHSGYQHIEGWSERVFDYIAAVETQDVRES